MPHRMISFIHGQSNGEASIPPSNLRVYHTQHWHWHCSVSLCLNLWPGAAQNTPTTSPKHTYLLVDRGSSFETQQHVGDLRVVPCVLVNPAHLHAGCVQGAVVSVVFRARGM